MKHYIGILLLLTSLVGCKGEKQSSNKVNTDGKNDKTNTKNDIPQDKTPPSKVSNKDLFLKLCNNSKEAPSSLNDLFVSKIVDTPNFKNDSCEVVYNKILNSGWITLVGIDFFSQEVIELFPSIKVIQIKNSTLSKFNLTGTILEKLECIMVENSHLENFSASGLPNLLYISLTHNKLTTDSLDIYNLQSLIFLDIGHNKIGYLPKSLPSSLSSIEFNNNTYDRSIHQNIIRQLDDSPSIKNIFVASPDGESESMLLDYYTYNIADFFSKRERGSIDVGIYDNSVEELCSLEVN